MTTAPRRLVTHLLAAAAVAPLAAVAPPTGSIAGAATAYETWTGRVVRASDGDTMQVNVDKDGRGAIPIRLIGVNAFELGECSADAATDRLDAVATDRRVTLKVPAGSEVDKYGRYHAYVTVNGSGVDVGTALLEHGTVWPVPKDWSTDEKTLRYYRAAMDAKARKVGIWRDDACGRPPSPDAKLDIRILRNPDGLDEDNPNKEWVKILNEGDSTVNLSGWGVRSSGEEKYTFPAGTKLRPGKWLKLHAGGGSNDARHHYWGLGRTMYSNRHPESVVVIDDLGNLRAFNQNPCLENCTDPLRGKVELRVSYDAPGSDFANPNGEWVDIVNTSASQIDLVDYVLINDQHRFIPAGGAKLGAGERMRVRVGSGRATRLEKFWGKPNGILSNRADEVVLRNIEGLRIAAIEWPCRSCAASRPDVGIVFVNPDPPGKDEDRLGQEYIVVRNDSAHDVNLRDWALRSGTNWYRFGGLTLPRGHQLRLVTGRGTGRTVGTTIWRYWNRDVAAISNREGAVELVGPALGVVDCYGWGGDPCERPERRRRLSVSVNADPDGSDTVHANAETIRIKNRESSTIDLSGYRVAHGGHVFQIRPGTRIAPGLAVTIHAGTGTSSRHHQYWGTSGGILDNDGGVVEITDTDGYRARRRAFS